MMFSTKDIAHALQGAGVDVEKEHPLVIAAMVHKAKLEAGKAIRAARQSTRDKAKNRAEKIHGC